MLVYKVAKHRTGWGVYRSETGGVGTWRVVATCPELEDAQEHKMFLESIDKSRAKRYNKWYNRYRK